MFSDHKYCDECLSSSSDHEEFKPNPGLNMNHGFIHHIRKNQINRDNYDKMKKVQAKNSKKKNTTLVEKSFYVPPHRKKTIFKQQTNNLMEKSKALFELHYTDNSDELHKVVIRTGDNPELVGQDLAKKANIPNELIKSLEWKIKREMKNFS